MSRNFHVYGANYIQIIITLSLLFSSPTSASGGTLQPVGTLLGHRHKVSVVKTLTVTNGDPIAVSGDENGAIILWDLASRSMRWSTDFRSSPVAVYALAVSSDRRILAAGGMFSTLSLFSISDGSKLRDISVPAFMGDLVVNIAFSGDSRFVTAVTALGNAYEFQTETGQAVSEFTVGSPGRSELKIFGQNEFLVSSSNNAVGIFSMAHGSLIRGYMVDDTDRLNATAFSADLRYMAIASTRFIRILSTASLDIARELNIQFPEGLAVEAMEFSPDQNRLLVWLVSETAPFPARFVTWDIGANQEIDHTDIPSWIDELPANTQWSWYQSAINPLGQFMLTADLDARTIKVYRF